MKLVLLGTSGYHPTDRRQTACLMLPEIGVVLDAGTGMYRVRDWLRTPALDIFLTHAHLDHVVGLTFLFDVLYQKSVERVTVHGEADKLAAIQEHLFAPTLFPAQPPITWQPLEGPVMLAGGGRLSYFPLEHPGGAIGFRLDWPDKSLAYVTDTTAKPNADYIRAIAGVDLLVHECYFTDDWGQWAEKTGHSCLTAVAQLAAAAQVGRMVLVHINPLDADAPGRVGEPLDLTSARTIFPEIELGFDRQVIEF
jgi:ribonuclease BN (tRNA processing enzyme)